MVVQELEMLFERSGRGENLAVLFLDVDRFKEVNDSHGHDVGDEVLKHIALQISESLRPTDTVGRYGGEEFLIGLPQCSVADAQVIAERMRARVEQSPFELADGRMLPLSVSIGVAGSPEGWEDLSELIREGDRFMYEAKRNGRNCVVG
jgi:two-component system cell cycle response regulator